MNLLLTGGGAVDHHRSYGVGHRLHHKTAQVLGLSPQQVRHTLAAGHQANGNFGPGVSLYICEHHSGALPGGALYRTARPYAAVNPRQLVNGIYLHIGLQVLPGNGFQVLQRGTQIVDGTDFVHMHTLLFIKYKL